MFPASLLKVLLYLTFVNITKVQKHSVTADLLIYLQGLYKNVFDYTPWTFLSVIVLQHWITVDTFWHWSQIKTLSTHLCELLPWKINLSEISGGLQQVFPPGFCCILLHSIYPLPSKAILALLQRSTPVAWCCTPPHFVVRIVHFCWPAVIGLFLS